MNRERRLKLRAMLEKEEYGSILLEIHNLETVIECFTKAMRKIAKARDVNGECGEYPKYPDGPNDDQCFDDWAADVADEALQSLDILDK